MSYSFDRAPEYPKPRSEASAKATRPLPEYLESHEVDALVRAAPSPRARLLFLVELGAGLRIPEALAVETRDLSLDTDRPTIREQQGKDRTGACRARRHSDKCAAVRQRGS